MKNPYATATTYDGTWCWIYTVFTEEDFLYSRGNITEFYRRWIAHWNLHSTKLQLSRKTFTELQLSILVHLLNSSLSTWSFVNSIFGKSNVGAFPLKMCGPTKYFFNNCLFCILLVKKLDCHINYISVNYFLSANNAIKLNWSNYFKESW